MARRDGGFPWLVPSPLFSAASVMFWQILDENLVAAMLPNRRPNQALLCRLGHKPGSSRGVGMLQSWNTILRENSYECCGRAKAR